MDRFDNVGLADPDLLGAHLIDDIVHHVGLDGEGEVQRVVVYREG